MISTASTHTLFFQIWSRPRDRSNYMLITEYWRGAVWLKRTYYSHLFQCLAKLPDLTLSSTRELSVSEPFPQQPSAPDRRCQEEK